MYDILNYVSIFCINKNNLLNNIHTIKNKLQKHTKLCAMVKADAYSHSYKHICKIINNYIDYFGVATINEGVKIRKQNIQTPILCVGSFCYVDLQKASKYNIDVAVYNEQSLQYLLKFNKKINVHFKVDTGMTRLGFKDIKQFLNAYKLLNQKLNINIVGIFSHFLDSSNINKSKKQFKIFKKFYKSVNNDTLIAHIANSNGIINKSFQLDMCRVGLSLYGYGNYTGLKPVLKIYSKVVDIHKIKKGQSVGYDAKYIANGNEIIATVAFGYADGLDMRYVGSCVKIQGKTYEIVGKICMNMFMVKVDDNVKIGDEVLILDDANVFAEHANKSVYEVLSNFKSTRAKIIVE